MEFYIINNNPYLDIKQKIFVREDNILKNRVKAVIFTIFISSEIIASI
ncbi:MAG: hypothetical protein ACTSRP_08535 [Candidatus Helarchaeota archaeon]